MKDFFQSRKAAAAAAVLGILAIALVIFEVGVTVGYHKAAFDYRWGTDYYSAFGPDGGRLPGNEEMPGSHGISGTIIKIDPPYAFIEGPDNVEKAVRIGSTTAVVKYRSAISPDSLSEGDYIVVIGAPDASSSDINAHFVRVLPPPPESASSSESR